MQEVQSEYYKNLRIAIYEQHQGQFVCCIYTGAFGYQIVEQFTNSSGLPPTKLFTTIELAVEHARTQIDSGNLRA